MGTRTVRLDEEAEKTLAKLKKMTGLSISEVLKRGLMSYKKLRSTNPRKSLTMYFAVSI